MRRADPAHRRPVPLGLAGAAVLAGLMAFLGFVSPAAAAPYSESEVRTVVETWVRHTTADARPDAVVERMEPVQDQGETLAWIAHLQGGGYCIAGADPVVLPIYLYVPQGSYRSDDSNLRAVVDEVIERSHRGRTELERGTDPSVRAELAGRVHLWSELLAGRTPDRSLVTEGRTGEDKAAPGLLRLPSTVAWNQPEPYFNHLPVLTPGSDEHTLVGCNAIATAQIMYWWKWPWTGVGSGSVTYNYRWRTTWDNEPLAFSPGNLSQFAGRLLWLSGGTLLMQGYWDASLLAAARGVNPGYTAYQGALTALWGRLTPASTNVYSDFGAAEYDWNQIDDQHFAPYGGEDFEIAQLCADVAIACESTLGVRETGSYFGNDVPALKDHFRYDTDALFSATANIDALKTEIEWGRLAGLGGTDANNAGHAWIVEGYDTSTDPNRLFWMNFGWGGEENGWYTFDSVEFFQNHDMMTRIAPTVVKFVGSTAVGDGSPAQPYQNLASALASAPDHSILHFRAGSDNGWTGTINRPLVLKGYGAVVH